LRHRFADKIAVDGIDLCIERGEVHGFDLRCASSLVGRLAR
jgi:ABC-type uncharacterized transport system ATPase subunit